MPAVMSHGNSFSVSEPVLGGIFVKKIPTYVNIESMRKKSLKGHSNSFIEFKRNYPFCR